ncbi:hypothetical protein A0J61_10569 [Choanephora cucurbitarum]|uniref:Uncharacterized protein n=1 Tax=Choanephora cucurbitarum TaxID=101091 RepID=A0A1C7MX41_9FUNG|nr:hypothetical protein A0J61_10569 [Choanephora cucurbitarum]
MNRSSNQPQFSKQYPVVYINATSAYMNFNRLLSSINGSSFVSSFNASVNDYTFCPGCGVDVSQFTHDDSCPYDRA